MPRTAVLLLDLQVDFLDAHSGRMPVGEEGAARVMSAVRAVLSGVALPRALPVVLVNAFPPSRRVANFFRNNAAVIGTPGAALDPRIVVPPGTPIFPKTEANAFSNPQLHEFLQSQLVTRVWVLGVFAEGCVRATALGAKALGYAVSVPLEGIATNARWKMWFAKRSMLSHGVDLPHRLVEAGGAA